MENQVLRKLFLGFIQVHILHHANTEPIYGSFMIHELAEHGYNISPGTLYPILHNLEKSNLLHQESKLENGKIRKYYYITEEGKEVLKLAKLKVNELKSEI